MYVYVREWQRREGEEKGRGSRRGQVETKRGGEGKIKRKGERVRTIIWLHVKFAG